MVLRLLHPPPLAGEGGRRRRPGGGVLQRLVDTYQHAFEIVVDIIVPESQHPEALTRQVGVPPCIATRVSIVVVLTAVDLNYQRCLRQMKSTMKRSRGA